MISDGVKEKIATIVGQENASFLTEERITYSYDATGVSYLPCGVVFPATAIEVSALLRLANVEGFPVVARGAGSGFTGGSLPVRGGLVLSTERMNKILDIDTVNNVASVEPGVVNGDLQNEVESLGLFYPPDPSSLNFSTIGGNIAECSGGPRAVKYGVTRDYVLGLEVVMATGEIINTGVKTLKGVVGYDLTRLIVGSEGTLGIVTKAHLRLIALPQARLTMLAAFSSLKDAARAVGVIMASGALPSTLEIIDSVCIGAVNDHSSTKLPEAQALLLIEVDGWREQCEREVELIRGASERCSVIDFKVASGKRDIRALWQARRSISQSLKKIRPDKLNEDVVVPRSRIVDLIEGVEDIAQKRGLLIANFGHAGDGNIHVNVMIDKTDDVEREEGQRAVEEVFALVIALGGTISGEHGVGTAKAPYLQMELGADLLGLSRRIKVAFDPNGILNPGKIFEGVEVSAEEIKS